MNILVTGGTGMIGQALQRILPEAIYVSSKDYDLRIQEDVNKMFRYIRPQAVIHLAALVSGIAENIKRPADHFDDNVLMNTFMVQAARVFECERFIGILSTCAYPDVADSYPMAESCLHAGPPAESNFSYAYAKRCMAVQIEATNRQYGTAFSYLTPCNVYGIGEKTNERSHFMGALLKKIYDAIEKGENFITLFGTGKPLRQYIYADDVALIIKNCLERNISASMNIAPDEVFSIDEIARIALAVCNCDDFEIKYDDRFPDGQFQKTVSNDLLRSKMPDIVFTSMATGIRKSYEYLRMRYGQ